MQAADIPTRMGVAFASLAAPGNIRTIPIAPPVEVGAASYELGFPPENMIPLGSGGVPPFGQDMNGIDLEITKWLQWAQAGQAVVTHDATFSTAIGGYPRGALLAADTGTGLFWLSLVDDNTVDPDAGVHANWAPVAFGTQYAVDSGTKNAGAVTLKPAPPNLASLKGRPISIQKMATANDAAFTLNPNALGATAVQNPDGTAIAVGQLPGSGVFTVVFDGTVFQLQSNSGAAGVTTTQAQAQGGNYDEDTGSVNALEVTLSPVPGSLGALVGVPIRVLVDNTTTVDDPTLNVNALGDVTIVNPDGSALAIGQVVEDSIAEFIYDGTNFQLISATRPYGTWGYFTANGSGGAATRQGGRGVTSARTGLGLYTLTLNPVLGTSTPGVIPHANKAGVRIGIEVVTRSMSTITLRCYDPDTNNALDFTSLDVQVLT